MRAKPALPPAARVSDTPAISTPQFFEMAGRERRLGRLVSLFQAAIEPLDAHAHHCSRLVLKQHAAPLFGNAPEHASKIMAAAAALDLGEYPRLLKPRGRNAIGLWTFPVPLPAGDTLIVSVALDHGAAELDRATRSRLNGLATIYAMNAIPLWEIEEDIETVSPLTLNERVTLAMLLSGYPRFEIAERLGCAMTTVALRVEHSIKKLSARDEAHAVALAARRGWLHISQEIGIITKAIDS